MSNMETKLGTLLQSFADALKGTVLGDLSTLGTAQKSTLVAALNEVKAIADAAGVTEIDDTVTSAAKSWSSTKVSTEITAAVAAALEGQDLSDLAEAIGALQSADLGLVSTTSAQSFDADAQAQARDNIGAIAASEVDFDPAAVVAGISL